MIEWMPIALAVVETPEEVSQKVAANLGNMGISDLLLQVKTVFLDYFPRVLGVIVFIILSLALLKALQNLVAKVLKRSKIDVTLHSFILGVIRNSVRVLIGIVALLMLKFPASPLITLIGSVGLALSLALKDSLANMAGGMLILFSHPFLKGDFIETKGVSGVVQSIDLVYTVIKSEDGHTVYLPNGDVAKSVVVNHRPKPEK